MESITSSREFAFLSLEKLRLADRYSNIETDTVIRRNNMSDEDKALYTALVYGTTEKRISLDYVIDKFSKTPTVKLEDKVLTVLRMGVYQILYLDKIPDSAACNESVKLCKKYMHRGTEGFVNGVLRAVCRGKESIEYPDKEKNFSLFCSVAYSLPVWLIDMWARDYGREKTEKIAEAFATPPFITLRTNTLKITREELLGKLCDIGIKAKATEVARDGIKLLDRYAVDGEFKAMLEQGLFTVQDESSQLCAERLGALPGETVVDTCACPGGKSFAIAAQMRNNGVIYSLDLHENKLSLIENGALKLGIDIIKTKAVDGREGIDKLFGKADRVLCDVPCSGLGVLSKKPDIRNKTYEDIARLPEIQLEILDRASNYLKENGILLYSTCTLNKAENEGVCEKFLATHPEFTLDNDGYITIFPDIYGSDGFFSAKFNKQN